MIIKKWGILVSIAGFAILSMTVISPPIFAATPVTTWEYDQIRPAITYNSKVNEYLAVWEDHHWGNGNDWDIYGQRIGSDGLPVGGRFGISWDNTQHRQNPTVAVNTSNGEYLVVWEYEYSPTDHDILARRLSSDGTLIGNEFVIANLTNNESSPAITFNPFYNEYLVVWKQFTGSEEFFQGDILAQRINADGTKNGSSFVITDQAYDEGAPAVAYNSVNAEYLVVWESQPLDDYNITGQRVASNGGLLGSDILISNWSYNQRRPKAAYNSQDNQYLVVWEDHHLGGAPEGDIYGQLINNNGSLLGSNFPISWDGTNSRLNPSVAYSKTGNEYLVVWEYVYSVTDHDIYIRRVKKDGSLIENEISFSASGSYEGYPALSSDGGLNYLLVWEDGRDAASQGINLYSSLYTLTALSGTVYVGNVGNETIPLGGATVRLYCSSNANELGVLLADNVTNSSGYYALPVSGSCNYYNIVEVDLPGYSSAGDTSIDGTVVDANRIRYSSPLSGKTLSSNKFWDHPPSTTTSCSSCDDCTAKLNGSYGTINLANNLTEITGSCIGFNASNATFDCQGHTISGTGGEQTYGIKWLGKTNNTIKNCTISYFETGIDLQGSTYAALNNNTLQHNTYSGIYLNESNSNTITSNSFTRNENGLAINLSDLNTITSNTLCKQKSRDIYGVNETTGNIQTNNKCDSIYNWNGNDQIISCDTVCTPNVSTTCSSATTLQNSLNGDFNHITLTNDIYVSSGFRFHGNHLTLDCNGHVLGGSGTSSGFIIDKQIGVEIKNCTIASFGTGIELRSASQNSIHNNQIIYNNTGISLSKTDLVLEPTTNSIANNSLNDNTNIGILLSAGKNNLISANTINNIGNYSIWVTGESCTNTLANNIGPGGKNVFYLNNVGYVNPQSIPVGNYGEIILCNVQNAIIENFALNNGTAKNDGILLINSSNLECSE